MNHHHTIRRSELYRLVWHKTQTQLCSELGVSRNDLLKICNELIIPRPKSGYWTQKQCGKVANVPPLPSLSGGEDPEINFPKNRKEEKLDLNLAKVKLTVPSRLYKPLPPIALAHQIYHEPTAPYEKLMGAPIGKHPEVIAIKVGKAQFLRALRIMNTLFKAFEVLGWGTSTIRASQTHLNIVSIDGTNVTFRIREELKQINRPLSAQEEKDKAQGKYVYKEKVLEPTGTLIFEINEYLNGHRSTWKDTHNLRLEDKLEEFLLGLARAQITIIARREENAKRHKEYELKRREAENRREIVKTYSSQIDELLNSFGAWKEANELKLFVNELINTALSFGPPSRETIYWFRWLEEVLMRHNPVTQLVQADKTSWNDEESTFRALRQQSLDQHPKLGGNTR
ncbi:MAG: hypothetical protein JXR18_11365 [Neptuniibacter sp.]